VSDVVSLDDYRERRSLERLLRASLGRCAACGRVVVEHRSSDLLACWTALTFENGKEPA
jgi:ribosomal protein L32